MKRRSDPTFPNDKVFRRFGSKSQLVSRILEYCRDHDGFDDVISLCTDTHISKEPERRKTIADTGQIGEGYLLKSGQFYKIGKTNAIGRRERELAIQLPEKSRTVHVIKTDDPAGIEAYWHTRFAAKRKHGEWFELNSEDLAAFKRRKFM
jgi:hypothetical protein